MGSMGPAMQVSLLLIQVFAIAFTLVFQESAGYVVSSPPIEVGRSSPVHQGKSFQRNGPSPPKGSFSVVPPTSHKAIKDSKGSHTRSPLFSLKHLAKNGFHSPATSPLWTFYRNHHARKKINGLAPAAFHPAPPHAIEQDCTSIVCPKPLTITPPGLPCGCAWPMKIGLRLSVALDTFFPLVSELAEEIASGVVLKRSQVRILGANAATQQPEKTVVLIDLVPLRAKFDNTRAYLTYKRFWHKQVAINASFFGDYEVMYVRYPGLPPSPPSSVDGSPYSGHDINRRMGKLLGVEVPRRPHKYYLSGNVIAIIALSACAAVVFSSAVVCVLLFSCLSLAKPAGIAGSVIGSGSSSASFSFDYGVTFSSTDIEKATDNLSFTRIIGEGGSGCVYSGILEDGMQVAVKKIKRNDQQGHREFLVEVETLKHLHHRNVVKLIGICTEQHCRCLVYELIPNGSVASHLHGVGQKTAPLDWGARMKIALGAARGLAYLHEDSSPRVIHRDFKSSNILLEHDFTPKVSDFGLARTTLDEENRLISTRVMGTIGYVDPEYAMTGHLLVKSDVYSYGVVLLELLTGRKAVDLSQQPESLVEWARPLLTSKEGLKSIIDSSLGSDVSESVAKVAAIASQCVQPKVSHRPSMGEVVQALKLASNECDKKGQVLVNELDIESRLSVTDSSFRWHSSSGPLRTGRRRPFWERIRELSRGSVSEHGFPFILRPGSQ